MARSAAHFLRHAEATWRAWASKLLFKACFLKMSGCKSIFMRGILRTHYLEVACCHQTARAYTVCVPRSLFLISLLLKPCAGSNNCARSELQRKGCFGHQTEATLSCAPEACILPSDPLNTSTKAYEYLRHSPSPCDRQGVLPDMICYSAAVAAARKGGCWEQALQLLQGCTIYRLGADGRFKEI